MKYKWFVAGLIISTLISVGSAATKVACVGNSITYGYGLEDSSIHNYSTVLQDSLGSNYTVTNYGVSSQTMLKNTNASYWNCGEIPVVRSTLPNIIIIELGTNDCKPDYWNTLKAQFETDYISMIDTFANLSSKPAIWICLQPPANNSSWSILDTTIKSQINPKIKEVALTKGVNMIDLYTELNKGRWNWFLSTDTVHLNVTGIKKMAAYIYNLMKADTCKITQNGTTLTAATAYSYQWYRNDTTISSGGNSQTLAISKKGTYKVSRRINSSDSSRLVDTITVSSTPTGIAGSMKNKTADIVYIDFVNNMLCVHMKGSVASTFSVSVLDLKGAEILSKNITGNSSATAVIPMSTENLRPGAYLYKISGGNADITGKFVLFN